MALFRIITVIMTIVATSLSGVMAASHGDSAQSGERHQVAMMMAGDDNALPACCDAESDRSVGCHMFPVIESSTPAATLLRAQGCSLYPDAAWSMTGHRPSGFLDPPRRA